MKAIFKTTLKTLAIVCSFILLLAAYSKTENQNQNLFTDIRDGHVYKTVTIGSQTWMAENLAYLPKINQPSEISESKPRRYVYNYDGGDVSVAKNSENYKSQGVLYNWSAAVRDCPKGWHLPGEKEWAQLENYLIANGYNFDKTITENKIAKSLSATTGWANVKDCGAGCIGNDLASNNRCGFSALPGGHYEGKGFFAGIGDECRFWSKKQLGDVNAWVRFMGKDNSNTMGYNGTGLYKAENLKYFGVSVRCVKD
jgi:uncharacterized protein (TIGR02145 family)